MAKINLIYSAALPNQSGVKSHLTIRQIQFTTSSILQFQKTFLSHLTRKWFIWNCDLALFIHNLIRNSWKHCTSKYSTPKSSLYLSPYLLRIKLTLSSIYYRGILYLNKSTLAARYHQGRELYVLSSKDIWTLWDCILYHTKVRWILSFEGGAVMVFWDN